MYGGWYKIPYANKFCPWNVANTSYNDGNGVKQYKKSPMYAQWKIWNLYLYIDRVQKNLAFYISWDEPGREFDEPEIYWSCPQTCAFMMIAVFYRAIHSAYKAWSVADELYFMRAQYDSELTITSSMPASRALWTCAPRAFPVSAMIRFLPRICPAASNSRMCRTAVSPSLVFQVLRHWVSNVQSHELT